MHGLPTPRTTLRPGFVSPSSQLVGATVDKEPGLVVAAPRRGEVTDPGRGCLTPAAMQLNGSGLVCLHASGGCNCAVAPAAAATSQSLDELQFMRSACAAAQAGNVERLRAIITRDPTCVSDDGVRGERVRGCWRRRREKVWQPAPTSRPSFTAPFTTLFTTHPPMMPSRRQRLHPSPLCGTRWPCSSCGTAAQARQVQLVKPRDAFCHIPFS